MLVALRNPPTAPQALGVDAMNISLHISMDISQFALFNLSGNAPPKGRNWPNWKNAEFDAVIDRIEKSTDPEEIVANIQQGARDLCRRSALAVHRPRPQSACHDQEGQGLHQRAELVPRLHARLHGVAWSCPNRDDDAAMWSYVARRLLYAVPILLGVSMLVFALIHLAPGDVVDILVPPEVPQEVADALRRRFCSRPADLHAVCGLARAPSGRRSRHLLLHQPAGGGRAVQRARQYAHAGPAGGGAGFWPRRDARRAGRLQSRHLARQGVLGDRDHRRQPAALLGRHRAGRDLRRRFSMCCRRRAWASSGVPDQLGAMCGI